MSRLLLRAVLLVSVVCAEVLITGPMAQAKGADPCPEPNDAFQAACYLGTGSDALGFISAAEDVDAYRFEVLDFGVKARLELAEMPGAYRLHLADWNGKVIAESTDQGGTAALEYTLGPPGSYYLFVDSKTGEASDASPYRLTTKLTYAGTVPNAVYANEFRSGQKGLCTIDYVREGWAECEAKDGKFIASFPGPYTSPLQRAMYGAWGPDLADFTLVADARFTGNPFRNTVYVMFRVKVRHSPNGIDGFDGVRLGLLLDERQLSVRRFAEEGREYLLSPDPLPQGDQVGLEVNGVNRIVVRAVGPKFVFNINGVEVAQASDDVLPIGQFAFGVASSGPPPLPTVSFDNALVTVP
jgi:hypothetical protein